MPLPTRRALNLFGCAACAALLAYAVWSQFILKVDPCPLCIFQRIGVAASGALFLLAGLHAPRGWGARVYGALLLATTLATAGVATRHLWIQHLPAGAVAACGASLNTLLGMFPLADVVMKVLRGSGECHAVNWSFLGLAMPAWVLLCALGLAGLAVLANLRRPPARGSALAAGG
jgi:disulfide bond formation protein DsbB